MELIVFFGRKVTNNIEYRHYNGLFDNGLFDENKFVNFIKLLDKEDYDMLNRLFFSKKFYERKINQKYCYNGLKINSNLIIDMVCNKIHNFKEEEDFDLSNYDDISFVFKSLSVKLLERMDDSNRMVVEIDCNYDLGTIIEDVSKLVKKVDVGDSWIKHCFNEDTIVRNYQVVKNYSDVSYNVNTGVDGSRAIGIWLFDYILDKECSPTRAIKELRKLPSFEKLGKADSSNRVFERIYARTEQCIEKAEVLSFS